MSDSLHNLITEPALGLAHRVRPAQIATEGKAPCLLLLHGVGANEAGFVELARQLDPRLVVILLRGPLAFGPMQFGWFQVNFTSTGPAINASQAEHSRRLLLDFIARLPQAYDIDPQRIWIGGFSQGGIMSASVGLTAPDTVSGFAILSGRILPEILPLVRQAIGLEKIAAYVAHGVHDNKLGIHFAREAHQLLQELGVPMEYREHEAGHELNVNMVRDFSNWISQRIDLQGASASK